MILFFQNKIDRKISFASKKGSALVYALVIMTVTMIILVSLLGYITSQLKFSFNRVEKEKSFQISEAGIYFYRWYLAYENSIRTPQEMSNFLQGNSALGVSSPYEVDYNGLGKYKIEVTKPQIGSTILTVKSTGWSYKEPNMKRVIEVRFRRPSWSEYMFLTNDFIDFGDQAEVYGRVHSNTGIRFDGLAHNVISSLAPSFIDPSHGGNKKDFGVHTHQVPADPYAPSTPPSSWPEGTVPDRTDVFEAGREFPVSEVVFNGVSLNLSDMRTESQKPNGTNINNCTTAGCYFNYNPGRPDYDDGKQIILKSDGTFDICTVANYQGNDYKPTSYRKNDRSGYCNSCGNNACTKNYSIPNNGVIFVEGNIWTGGTVNGKRITIAASSNVSPANIYIGNGNLRYSAYDCNNSIGLVAQNDILVIKGCPDDFIVDAALLAQTGRVGMNDYGTNIRSLTINGAIVSYFQPYFNHGNNGFGIRTYNFDNNLLYCPPAFFPTGTNYSIDLWREL